MKEESSPSGRTMDVDVDMIHFRENDDFNPTIRTATVIGSSARCDTTEPR